MKPARAPLLSLLWFLAIWALLDVVFNLRAPGREPALWYLLPSLDVVALFALFALLGWRGRRLPAWTHGGLAALIVLVRVLRIADGAVEHYFWRTLNLYVDVPLFPELLRLLRSTVSLPVLALAAVLALAILVGLWWLLRRALAQAERYLAAPRHAALFAAAVVLCAALSPLWRGNGKYKLPLHAGLFGVSVVPRLGTEAAFLLHARAYRRDKIDAMHAAAQDIRTAPGDLQGLGGADLLLFFVESYGETVLERPEYARRMAPVYAAFQRALAGAGFTVASGLLDSPTYGGSSWLAHATMATGVRAADELEYTLLRNARPQPKTMAQFFAGAGYRTVLVQPGTTRPWPEGVVQGFQRKYYAFDIVYRGPSFSWALVPDQYVIDFVHQQEVARPDRPPLFVEYALVSSHAPWNLQAPLVDWSRLGDGSIYRQVPAARYPVTWTNLGDGGEAYVASIVYDLQVLQQYVTGAVTRPALVIVLGDHQPVGDVTGQSPSHAVPVHVMSRDRALVQPFLARGYVDGMQPRRSAAPPPGMETFLPSLLHDLTRASAAAGAAR